MIDSFLPAFLADSASGSVLMKIARILFICIEVVVMFNLLIIVHEWGHFLAARWRKLYIEGFGIWFGKPIWKKKINGVLYTLGSIPAGGFVKLPQMAPMEAIEGESEELPPEARQPIKPLDKIIVAFAGPLFSFMFAWVCAVVVWQVGRPVPEAEGTTVIGYVDPEGPAAKAGIQPGDKFLEVDGQPVKRFQGMDADAITWRIVRSEGATIPVKFERNGQVQTVNITPEVPKTGTFERSGLRRLAVGPMNTPIIHAVKPGSPAAKAGFQAGDVLISANGKKLYDSAGIADELIAAKGQPVKVGIKRGEQTSELDLTPAGLVVERVMKGSPAETGGLQPGDRVLSVDGAQIFTPMQVSEAVKKGVPMKLAIERDGQKIELGVKPEVPIEPKEEKEPKLGLIWGNPYGIELSDFGPVTVAHPTPYEQVRGGVATIVNTLGAVTSPKSDISVQHLGGPVLMMRIYYRLFENPDGWRYALWFSVILNVNLAILNMLPIPVLDGGHILTALIEAVARRPIHGRILEYIQTAAALTVIGFMLFVTFFDVRELPLFGGTKAQPYKFAPRSEQTGK